MPRRADRGVATVIILAVDTGMAAVMVIAKATAADIVESAWFSPTAVREEPPDPKEGGLPLCRFFGSLSHLLIGM